VNNTEIQEIRRNLEDKVASKEMGE